MLHSRIILLLTHSHYLTLFARKLTLQYVGIHIIDFSDNNLNSIRKLDNEKLKEFRKILR